MADIAADGMKFRVGRVLTRSFSVYFGNIVAFATLALVITSPTYIYMILQGPQSSTTPENPMAVLEQLGPEPFIVFIANLFLGQLVAAALVYGTIQDLKHERASLGDCFSRGVAVMLPVFGVAVAQLVILFLVLFVSVLPAGFIVAIVSVTTGSEIFAFALMGLSFIPAIYVWVMLWAAIPVAVIERRGLGSFRRSAQLTRGYRWRIFLLLILILALSFAIGLLVNAVGAAGARSSIDQFATGVAVEWIVAGFAGALSAVISAVSYHDLRVAKEGLDTSEIASVFD